MNRKLHILTALGGLLLSIASAKADLRLIPSAIQGTVGTAVSIQLIGRPVATGSYVFSGDLSAYGLSLSSSGLVSGVPTVATSGQVTVSLSITDTGNPDAPAQTVNLGISISPPPLSITTASLPSGISGKGFTSAVTMAATGGVEPYTWSLAIGSLNGLTLNSNGTFSGTFNSVSSATSVPVTIQVTDSVSTIYRQAYTFTLYPLLQITAPSTLGYGVAGKAISPITATASGASGTPVWSATGLPQGISINASTGVISGSPTVASLTNTSTITVQDPTSGQSASAQFSMPVYPALIYNGPSSFGPAVIGQVFPQVQASATGGTGTYAYSATGLPSGLTINASTGVISGTPNGSAGASSVTVTVSDSASGQTVGSGSLTLQVYTALRLTSPASMPPAVQNQTYTGGTFSATGGSGTYSWSATGLPSGITINTSTGAISGSTATTGSSNVVVTVQDSASGQSASSPSLPLTVYTPVSISAPTSFGPAVLNKAFGPVQISATGGSGTYTYSATGLPAGLSVNSSTGAISGTPNGTAGLSSVTVTVADATSGQTVNKSSLALSVYPQITLSGPSTLPFGIIGQTYSGTSFTANGGSGTYSFSLTGATSGLSINASGQLRGTVSGTAGPTTVTVALQDSTSGQSISTAFPITLYTYPSVTAPNGLPTGVAGKPYQGTNATGSGGSGNFTWSQSGLPGGLSINTSSGAIGGSISGASGTYTVNITLTDTVLSVTATKSLTLQVYAPVTITGPASLPAGTYGVSYPATQIQTSGGSGSYSWAASNVAGLSISSTGIISGTPNSGGTFQSQVTVYDLVTNQSASQSFTLTISYPVLSILGKTGLGAVAVNGSVSASFSPSGGLGPYTWKSVGSLPAGLSLSGTGALTGSPSIPGNYTFTISVTDSEPQPVTVSTNVNLGVVGLTSGSTLPAGNTASNYAYTFTAVGGNGSYVFSAPNGVPAGLTLSTAGLLSGKPKSAGSFSFLVNLSDSSGVQTSGSFSLVVTTVLPVAISTASTLSPGTVNVPYALALTATGGNPPYSWSVTGGNLPAGISLDRAGNLSGTPTAAGTSSFTVTATDGSGGSSSAPLSLTIAPAKLQFSNTNLPSGVVSADYPQQLLGASGGVGQITYSAPPNALPPGVSLSPTGVITCTPSAKGTYSFQVTATDTQQNSISATFTINVRDVSTDLILSASVLNFALTAGTNTLPDAQAVTVKSSSTSTPINYTVSGGATWLSVDSGSGTTPSTLRFSLSANAQTLSASPAPTTISVTCTSSSCNGNVQQVTVSLNITAPPPQLTVITDRLSFSADSASLQSVNQTIQVKNTGGGTINVSSAICNAPWCTIGASTGSIAA